MVERNEKAILAYMKNQLREYIDLFMGESMEIKNNSHFSGCLR